MNWDADAGFGAAAGDCGHTSPVREGSGSRRLEDVARRSAHGGLFRSNNHAFNPRGGLDARQLCRCNGSSYRAAGRASIFRAGLRLVRVVVLAALFGHADKLLHARQHRRSGVCHRRREGEKKRDEISEEDRHDQGSVRHARTARQGAAAGGVEACASANNRSSSFLIPDESQFRGPVNRATRRPSTTRNVAGSRSTSKARMRAPSSSSRR